LFGLPFGLGIYFIILVIILPLTTNTISL